MRRDGRPSGNTALHYAAVYGAPMSVVEALLPAGRWGRVVGHLSDVVFTGVFGSP